MKFQLRSACPVAAALVLGLAAILVRLFVVSWRLPIDPSDAYEYLFNARILAGHDLSHLQLQYDAVRAPLLPILLSPIVRWYQPAGEGPATAATHLLAVGLGALALFCAYRLYARGFELRLRLAGVLLIAIHPLFVQLTPLVGADVPSMLLGSATLLAVSRTWERRRAMDHLLLAICLTAAGLIKYPLVVLGPALAASELCWALAGKAAEPRPRAIERARAALRDYRLALVLLGSAATFYLVHVGVFAHVFEKDTGAWTRLLAGLRHALASVDLRLTDPPYEYLAQLGPLSTVPAAALGVLGTLVALRRRSRLDLLHLVWFSSFVAVMSLAVAHKEARYFMPALPSWIYLEVLGLEWLLGALGRFSALKRHPGWTDAVAIGLALAWPVRMGVAELRRLDDPLYARPLLPPLARWVRERLEPDDPLLAEPWVVNDRGARYWVHTLYPAERTPVPFDEYFQFFHVNQFGLAYFLDRDVRRLELTVGHPGPPVLRRAPHVLTLLHDGSWSSHLRGDPLLLELFETRGAVLSTSQGWYDRMNAQLAPEPPRPIEARFYERRTLLRQPGPEANSHLYVGGGAPSFLLWRTESGFRFDGNPPAPDWRLYQRRASHLPAEPFDVDKASEPPAVLELLREERASFAVR